MIDDGMVRAQKIFRQQIYSRVLPRKILGTKKAGEAISGHFVVAILPSISEDFQRMLLPFILYALFK